MQKTLRDRSDIDASPPRSYNRRVSTDSGHLPPATSETLVSPELPVVSGRAAYLGLVEYSTVWQLQLRLVEERTQDRIADTLLLCQHPDVITVGRRQRAQENILDPRFPLFEVERGGDATYHGPGQLVGYPILKLRPRPAVAAQDQSGGGLHGERDLHLYLRALEGALMDLCAELGVSTERKPGATGVWLADKTHKLASLGIAVRRWVTFHGFALNVYTDLSRFTAINPCGFRAEVMTSLAAAGALLPAAGPGDTAPVEALVDSATRLLGARLNRQFTRVAAEEIMSLAPAPTPAG
jgi:lipoyl(octanoyl) transferase